MLDQLFRRPRVRDRIRANILGAWIELYVAYLDARGHPPGVIQQYVQAVEHLGAWLTSEHIAVEAGVPQSLEQKRTLSRADP